MKGITNLELLGPWMDALLEAQTPHTRARLVCEVALSAGAVAAVGLWRRIEVGGRTSWARVAFAGVPEALPSEELASEFLEDRPCELAGLQTLRTRDAALVLCESRLEEEALDVVQSLLSLYVLVAEEPASEAVRGALPGGEPEEDPRTPAEFMRDLQDGAALMELIGEELSDAERREMEELLDTQMRRAEGWLEGLQDRD